jgi:hypothetical protein
MPIRPALDARIDAAYLTDGYEAAGDVAEQELGWRPNNGQLDACIGRHAWILGEARGNQTYQLRMMRQGRDMSLIDPDGLGSELRDPVTRGLLPSIDRHFGIEVEFNVGSGGYGIQTDIVNAASAAGVPGIRESYSHQVPNGSWRMRPDSTVSGGEFVSPILSGVDGHNQVRTVLRCVREAGGGCGQGQGMHVHHDVRDHTAVELERLIHNLQQAEMAFLHYCPRYRWDGSGGYRGNRQSATAWEAYKEDVLHGYLAPQLRNARRTYSRYVSFNMNSILSYGSIEFRALGNTLNGQKIKTWIRVGQAFIAWSKADAANRHTGPITSQEMVDMLVDARQLPRREAERFMAVVAHRNPQTAVA